MTPKHAPGPLRQLQCAECGHVFDGPESIGPEHDFCSPACLTANVNAKQLADAAPELLAALQHAERQIEVLKTWLRPDTAPLTVVRASDTQAAARAAIAKAQGTEPHVYGDGSADPYPNNRGRRS